MKNKKHLAVLVALVLGAPAWAWAQSGTQVEVSSITHPQEGVWYSNSNPEFAWARPPGAYGFSFLIDQNPDTVPDDILDTTITTTKTYQDLTDGEWFFHIKSRDEGLFSFNNPTHYKVNIDTQPPVITKADLNQAERLVYFESQDSLSGVAGLTVQVGDQVFNNVNSPFKLPRLKQGLYEVSVLAADAAGNTSVKKMSYNVVSNHNWSAWWNASVDLPMYLVIAILLSELLVLLAVWVLVRTFLCRKDKSPTIPFLQTNPPVALESVKKTKRGRTITKPKSRTRKTKSAVSDKTELSRVIRNLNK